MTTLKLKKRAVFQAMEELGICEKKKDESKKSPEFQIIEIPPDVEAQCKIARCYKRNAIRHCFKGATKNSILSEIRSRIHQRNWNAVKDLLLLLLPSTSANIEPLIWHYCLILALYSGNTGNISNVFNFFELCAGSEKSVTIAILRNILSLNKNKTKNENENENENKNVNENKNENQNENEP